MAHRKDLFQAKVLQKLYAAAPKPKEEPKPPHIVEIPAKNTCVKRKAPQVDPANDAGKTQGTSNTDRRRLYTVLPPPADYKPDPEKSITLPLLDSIKSDEDTAENSNNSCSEELDHEEKEEEQKRKRRRRKRKPALHQDSCRDEAAPVSGSSTGQSQAPVGEGGEHISRNKKRKLKKKRHKEKLRSMGLMPRAAALEFTYQKGWEEEEQDVKRRAAEVAEFLRTTTEFYLSDFSSHMDKLPLSRTLDDLMGSIASRDEPASILKQLYNLKLLVHQREIEKLEKALMEFQNTSCLAEEETTAVVSLFQYWITDILPVQGDKTTGLSTKHP